MGALSYVTIEITDCDGNLVQKCDSELEFKVSGGGSLLALGNGNPKTEEKFTGSRYSTYQGRAMAVICSSGKEGDICLTVSGGNLPDAIKYL
jgi:beta-galactosidase